MRPRQLLTLSAALLCFSTSFTVLAQDTEAIQSALSARVSFTDMRGASLPEIPRNEPFNITVAIENTIGTEPPAGLYLQGWLRKYSHSNSECHDAARAYRATGRTPVDSIKLNGPIIGVLTEEGHLTIVDPDIDLASANLIGATSFGELPAGFAADADTSRFFVSLSTAGSVLVVNALGGETQILIDTLDAPGALIPSGNGSVWVHEQGSGDLLQVNMDGSYKRHSLNALSVSAGENGHSLLVYSDTEMHLLERSDGRRIVQVLRHRFSPPVEEFDGDVAVSDDANVISDAIAIENRQSVYALAALSGRQVALHYVDDPQNPIHINLVDDAQRLAVDPSGRYLFAFAPAGGKTSIIDLARSRVVQVVGADIPVVNVEFTDNAAFLLLADQSIVGVVELASIRMGSHAMVREVSLGEAVPYDMTSQKKLLARLLPHNEVLAVHSKNYTGFVVHETSAMGDAPPMSAIKLRGGVPYQARVLDRSFKEISTGTFRTTAMLPSQGRFELVVTTGIGSLSACTPLVVEAAETEQQAEPGTIAVVREPAVEGTRLRLTDANGDPADSIKAEVTFSALEANWRFRADLQTNGSGLSHRSYDLPALGEYVITVATGTEQKFKPVLHSVR